MDISDLLHRRILCLTKWKFLFKNTDICTPSSTSGCTKKRNGQGNCTNYSVDAIFNELMKNKINNEINNETNEKNFMNCEIMK